VDVHRRSTLRWGLSTINITQTSQDFWTVLRARV